jgi:hypothetical protein
MSSNACCCARQLTSHASLQSLALQTLQTVAFLSSFSMLKPKARFLVLVPKVCDTQV